MFAVSVHKNLRVRSTPTGIYQRNNELREGTRQTTYLNPMRPTSSLKRASPRSGA